MDKSTFDKYNFKIENGVKVHYSDKERKDRLKNHYDTQKLLEQDYLSRRIQNNPSTVAQLNAIWKHLKYCRDKLNQPLHPETNLTLEKMMAIDEKYPKPTNKK